jgi:NAD(P)-dependent dehydrogenase (short-subunit alcohol dehydrogenase family)
MDISSSPFDLIRLDGKVAIVTGGSRGIGRSTVNFLSAAGASVVVFDKDVEAGRLAVKNLGTPATAIEIDVCSEAEVADAVSSVITHFGSVDILVNNAGASIRKPTVDLPLAEWNRVFDVNVTGVFLCARAVAPQMIRQGSGVIVNVASIFGLSGGGLYPNISYQASKGAVVNMTRALAMEWAGAGIRVNAVAPTWVNTEFIAALKANPDLMQKIELVTPLGRLAEPEEVASAILYLASPASSMVTGHILPVDGGFLAQ